MNIKPTTYNPKSPTYKTTTYVHRTVVKAKRVTNAYWTSIPKHKSSLCITKASNKVNSIRVVNYIKYL